jgi:hypothetical protein
LVYLDNVIAEIKTSARYLITSKLSDFICLQGGEEGGTNWLDVRANKKGANALCQGKAGVKMFPKLHKVMYKWPLVWKTTQPGYLITN